MGYLEDQGCPYLTLPARGDYHMDLDSPNQILLGPTFPRVAEVKAETGSRSGKKLPLLETLELPLDSQKLTIMFVMNCDKKPYFVCFASKHLLKVIKYEIVFSR